MIQETLMVASIPSWTSIGARVNALRGQLDGVSHWLFLGNRIRQIVVPAPPCGGAVRVASDSGWAGGRKVVEDPDRRTLNVVNARAGSHDHPIIGRSFILGRRVTRCSLEGSPS